MFCGVFMPLRDINTDTRAPPSRHSSFKCWLLGDYLAILNALPCRAGASGLLFLGDLSHVHLYWHAAIIQHLQQNPHPFLSI